MSVVTEEMKGRAAEAIGDAFGGSCMRQAGSCYDDPEFCGCQRAAAAALAAVAPLIAKVERERCARMAHQHGYDLTNLDERNGAFSSAAAIRALGDET